MITETLARNLHQFVDDPHEFCTAFVKHKESSRTAGLMPYGLRSAIDVWRRDGALK